MTDEKQIVEQLKKDICSACDPKVVECYCSEPCAMCEITAEKLAKKYQPKLSENMTVLSEEELKNIIKEEYKNALKDKVVLTKEEYENTILGNLNLGMEMGKMKIWRKVITLLKMFEIDKMYLLDTVYDLAKQDGVEVQND